MITRKEYMNALPKYGSDESMAHHRTYFAQFVDSGVIALVKYRIGLDRIMQSNDPHFNDILLPMWDAIWMRSAPGKGLWIDPPAHIRKLLRETGEGNSAATGICILKEAARQIKEINNQK